jgi:hypothetical protein
MIAYRAVPYLLVAAPPVIVVLTILIGGCTMTRTANDPVDRVRFYSNPDSRAGDGLILELDRRVARQELRRIIEEAQR